jgi:hypothetical protein
MNGMKAAGSGVANAHVIVVSTHSTHHRVVYEAIYVFHQYPGQKNWKFMDCFPREASSCSALLSDLQLKASALAIL